MSLQTLVNKSLVGKKVTPIGELLASLRKSEVVLKAKKVAVAPATREQMRDEIPETILGIYPEGLTADKMTVGVPYVGHVNKRGIAAMLMKELDGTVRCERPGVQLGKNHAKYISDQFKNHNRIPKVPQIKRLTAAMDEGRWFYAANTCVFTVEKVGDATILGQGNMGHTCLAFIDSMRTTPLPCIVVIGVPKSHANVLDTSMARTSEDIIGIVHRFDKYVGLSEFNGSAIPVKIDEKNAPAFNKIHSQALRILYCIETHKASVKDSVKLEPDHIAALDSKYGDVLEQLVFASWLLDQTAPTLGKGDKPAVGGLHKIVSVSHVAALWTLFAAQAGEDGQLVLSEDDKNFAGEFFLRLCQTERYDDKADPAVALRNGLHRWKINGDAKSKSQNAKWNALKLALRIALSEATGEAEPGSLTMAIITGVDEKTKCYFETELDQTPPEKTEATDIAEMDEDEELEELDE